MSHRRIGLMKGQLRALATWVPLGFFLIGISLIGVFWTTAQRAERMRQQIETQVTAEQVKRRLEAWIDGRVAVVRFFAQDFGADPSVADDRFRRNAATILELYPGFQAINYIDRNWVIRLICPHSGNQAALDSDLHDHPARGVPEALGRAQETGAITRTPLIDLLQGKPGFATYCPLTLPDGESAGFLNGVFSVEGLVDGCLSDENLQSRFRVGLTTPDGRDAYWTRGLRDEPWPDRMTIALPLRVLDGNWTLKLAPSPANLKVARFGPDEFLAAAGALLAVMLAFLLRAYLLRVVELRNSREGYRLLVDNVADMVLRVQLDGRVTFASPSFWRFLDRGEPEITGTSLTDFAHPDDRQEILAARARITDGSAREQFEVRLKTPGGFRWTSWTGAPYRTDSDRLEGLVGVGRDIHARRELEEQLMRSQKLQAVGQLAGGIAHDFNNIIQAVQGYIEFVIEDLPPDSESREDLNQALLAAARAAKLTRQLLAFSSRQSIKPLLLDLRRVIDEMAPMLGAMFGEAISLKLDPGPDPLAVKADPGQIEQILMNLCVNARDAISGSGQVTLATGAEELTDEDCRQRPWARPGRWVRLTVADDGMGMDQETLGRAFEPFFTTKDPGRGTGLGLATVYGIVKQHGGLVHIESEPGQGTAVSVFLPLTEERSPSSDPVARSRQGGRGETVLVVEDQDQVRSLCTRILGQAGYEVLTAADGEEAVRIFADHRSGISLVLLDLVLPGQDGRAVQAQIRTIDPGIRILFMSGFDPISTKSRESGPAPDDLLAKPFAKEDLLEAVRRILDRPPPGS